MPRDKYHEAGLPTKNVTKFSVHCTFCFIWVQTEVKGPGHIEAILIRDTWSQGNTHTN